jgi:hypothetical protein
MFILHPPPALKINLSNQQTIRKFPYIKLYENPIRFEAFMAYLLGRSAVRVHRDDED